MLYKFIPILIFSFFLVNSYAFSETWHINIEGYLSGFKVGESKATLEINNNKYKLEVLSNTSGITKLFYPWKQSILVSGLINNFNVKPSFYNIQDIREDKKTGYINVKYQNKFPLIVDAYPDPNLDTRRKKVSKNLLREALDPVNALIALGLRSSQDNNCNQIINVFDGRRRFDLKFIQFEKNISELKCKLKIIRIAGYSKKELNKHPKEGFIILKKLSKYNLYFPIEVKIPLSIGSFYVTLSDNLLLE